MLLFAVNVKQLVEESNVAAGVTAVQVEPSSQYIVSVEDTLHCWTLTLLNVLVVDRDTSKYVPALLKEPVTGPGFPLKF